MTIRGHHPVETRDPTTRAIKWAHLEEGDEGAPFFVPDGARLTVSINGELDRAIVGILTSRDGKTWGAAVASNGTPLASIGGGHWHIAPDGARAYVKPVVAGHAGTRASIELHIVLKGAAYV
jgi:hypothetical protein